MLGSFGLLDGDERGGEGLQRCTWLWRRGLVAERPLGLVVSVTSDGVCGGLY